MQTQSAWDLSAAVAPVTVLSGGKVTTVSQGAVMGDDLWLKVSDLPAVTGWEMKPEGVCRDEACLPLKEEVASRLLQDRGGERWFNLTAFARHAGQPVSAEEGMRVWSLGTPAYERQSRAGSDLAPNFTLPDFEGKPHSLADYTGKKVFLLTWASW
jgi:hypothetical protein